MVLGRLGMKFEGAKFGVYIIIPVGASIMFNDPDVQAYWADYFQFLRYPANPNINLKEQYDEAKLEREKKKEQRQAYQEQLRILQTSAQESRRRLEEQESSSKNRRWFGLFG